MGNGVFPSPLSFPGPQAVNRDSDWAVPSGPIPAPPLHQRPWQADPLATDQLHWKKGEEGDQLSLPAPIFPVKT